MNTWAPLWCGIVGSSIWDEDDFVVKVFLTMLALKDADHIVRLNAYQLAQRCGKGKTELQVMEALKVLMSPDTKRLEKQEFDGRRIKAVEEGWLVLNGEKYRAMVSLEMKRARNRKAQAAWRARKKRNESRPLPGEVAYENALNNGNDAEAERILDNQPGMPQEAIKEGFEKEK